jgi:hypothetical protein
VNVARSERTPQDPRRIPAWFVPVLLAAGILAVSTVGTLGALPFLLAGGLAAAMVSVALLPPPVSGARPIAPAAPPAPRSERPSPLHPAGNGLEPPAATGRSARHAPAAAGPPGRRPLTTMTSQVLFSETDGEHIHVDAALLGVDHVGLAAGGIFHLQLRSPETPGLREVAASVLGGWADEGRVVEVEVRDRGDVQRARLTDGVSALVLDLEQGDLPGATAA